MTDRLLEAAGSLPLWQAAAVGAGVVAAVGAWLLVRAALRKGWQRRLVRPVAVLVLLLSAEGFYELLVGPVGLPQWAAVLWAGVIELSVVAMAQLAERAMSVGRWGYAVGVIVTIYATMLSAGLMAAAATGSSLAGGVRLAMPLLGATLWLVDALYEHVRPAAGSLSWLWTPRRLAVAVGAMAPDGDDLEAVAQARRQRVAAREERRRHRDGLRLARLALRHRRGVGLLAGLRAAQLDRLLEAAPAAAVEAAQSQVERAQAARSRLLQPAQPTTVETAQPPAAVEAAPAAQPPAVRLPQPAAPAGPAQPTRERVADLLRADPELSNAEIGRRLSVTRQTVATHRSKLAEVNGYSHADSAGAGE